LGFKITINRSLKINIVNDAEIKLCIITTLPHSQGSEIVTIAEIRKKITSIYAAEVRHQESVPGISLRDEARK
jgi:hypothetical protein